MARVETLLYKARRPQIEVVVLDAIAGYARQAIEARKGLRVAEVEVYTFAELVRKYPDIHGLLEQAAQVVGQPCEDLELVICEWAAPHEDGTFDGQVFTSLVVHTGKNPYYMQTVVTQPRHTGLGRYEVSKGSVVLSQGDMLVFDPTVPHMAAPTRPADGQLLVLLQWMHEFNGAQDEHELRMQFPEQGVTDHIREVMLLG
jgi:hypothetical protein